MGDWIAICICNLTLGRNLTLSHVASLHTDHLKYKKNLFTFTSCIFRVLSTPEKPLKPDVTRISFNFPHTRKFLIPRNWWYISHPLLIIRKNTSVSICGKICNYNLNRRKSCLMICFLEGLVCITAKICNSLKNTEGTEASESANIKAEKDTAIKPHLYYKRSKVQVVKCVCKCA